MTSSVILVTIKYDFNRWKLSANKLVLSSNPVRTIFQNHNWYNVTTVCSAAAIG